MVLLRRMSGQGWLHPTTQGQIRLTLCLGEDFEHLWLDRLLFCWQGTTSVVEREEYALSARLID